MSICRRGYPSPSFHLQGSHESHTVGLGLDFQGLRTSKISALLHLDVLPPIIGWGGFAPSNGQVLALNQGPNPTPQGLGSRVKVGSMSPSRVSTVPDQ